MLRWKTPSALCAIMLTACPLTSFAQQIVKPAPPEISILQPLSPIKLPGQIRKVAYEPLVPLVSPEEAIAANPTLKPPSGNPEVRTAALSPLVPTPPIQLRKNPTIPPRSFSAKYRPPESNGYAVQRAASPEIIIRTPFVQPHNPNLYLFVVENVGTVDATAAAVDLYVPQGVVITNVVPATATNTAQRAHIRLTDLKAGSKSIIEVEVSPTTDVVEFQTRMSLESVHKFTTAANPNFVARSLPATPLTPPTTSQTSKTLTIPTTPVESIASATPSTPSELSTPAATTLPLKPLVPLAISPPAAPVEKAVAAVAKSAVAEAIDTTGRSGKAQPPNIANAIANNANASQAQLVSSTKVAAQATADAKLTATVDGPVTLNAQQAADFSITVTNPNQTEATGIIVQLSVPAGLKVTVLDREAWFDEANQTISWEINQLGSGQQETIQYRAVGQAIGQQNQKVTIGMQDVYQGKAQLVTLVSN